LQLDSSFRQATVLMVCSDEDVFSTGKNIFFLEESERVRAEGRRTALSRMVVVVVAHKAIQRTHQVVMNALKWFMDETRSDDALSEKSAHIA